MLLMAFPLLSNAQVKKNVQQSNQEKTTQDKRGKQPSKDKFIKSVRKYIVKEQKRNNGYFHVYDSVTKKTLKLKLDTVHTDKFAHMGNDIYFDCADFKGADAKDYDIDIFMKWNGKKFVSTTQRKVHKVNGEARYVWYKDGDIWKTKPATKGNKKEGPDHPGH